MNSQYILIEDAEQFESLARTWHNRPFLYVDTEFERSRTFYAKPALVQIADHEHVYLIDPLKIEDFSSLAAIWASESTTKVLHAASEDIEVLSKLVGCAPKAIFDTQIAAAILGYGFSLGYAALTETVTNIRLPKQETRSNWLLRPLKESQLDYAALDVAYLPAIHGELADGLNEKSRQAWLSEECNALATKHGVEPHDFLDAYLKFGQTWKLTPLQLGMLRALCAWRENEARRRDKPRSHVIGDSALFQMARSSPRNLEELRRIDGISDRFVKYNASVILRILEKVRALTEDKLPQTPPPPTDLRPFAKLVQMLKSTVAETAKQHGMNPEILAHRRAIETLLRHRLDGGQGLTNHFEGWRREVVGLRLLELVETKV